VTAEPGAGECAMCQRKTRIMREWTEAHTGQKRATGMMIEATAKN